MSPACNYVRGMLDVEIGTSNEINIHRHIHIQVMMGVPVPQQQSRMDKGTKSMCT